ncbi:putative transcriptional regulator SLK2 [Drosera capensis]
MNSSHQLGSVPPMAPSRMAGGLLQSQASSGIFVKGERQSQNLVNSQFISSFENSFPGGAHSTLGPVSMDTSQGVLNGLATSGPSIGASSLLTDGNSNFSRGSLVQRSASISTESHMRLPASPMSFTSNKMSVSGSAIMDGSLTVQQNSQQDLILQQSNQNHQLLQKGAPGRTSSPAAQAGQKHLPLGPRLASTFIHDVSNLSELQKKPRMDIKQEEPYQSQHFNQVLQKNDLQLTGHHPPYQAFLQPQHRLRQEQYLQSMPQMRHAQLQKQHHQQQLQNHLQQQGIQHTAALKNTYDSNGVCARRLMQYLYHQRQRGQEGTIAYWRKFVAEYYAPRAKKRWCLSLYDNVGQHALGTFPQTAMASSLDLNLSSFARTLDAWHCDICGARSGRGFEATYEVLPGLNELKFNSGVLDELLFLDWPRERRLPSGLMILEYGKAVQESIYEQLRVVREGQLRIIFTQDLKIMSWEFCARRHEELLSKRVVAPQVAQLLQVVQKCQSTIFDAGSDGVASQDLQANSSMVVTAGRQLAKSLELQTLNELGFPKRYVRCLQIAEVFNHMKDLIDFCKEAKLGPIEGLKNYTQLASTSKIQMQKLQKQEQMSSAQGLPIDRNTLGKNIALHSGASNMDSQSSPTPSAAAAVVLNNYPNKLMTSNGPSPLITHANSLQQEPSLDNSVPHHPGNAPLQPVQHSQSRLSTPSLPGQQPLQHQYHAMLANSFTQRNQQSSQSLPPNNEALQKQMIQQLLQDMSNSNGTAVQLKSPSVQHERTSDSGSSDTRAANCETRTADTTHTAGSSGEPALNKSNSFKAASNSSGPSAVGGENTGSSHLTTADLDRDLDITDDLLDSGFFNDLEDFS